ncbi:hypothetical protein M3Y95_00649700 [Aphelenchoides besseyi]|nr:hypothetical protein M3Y95_00649700 [Aphelenchoides besseyi]
MVKKVPLKARYNRTKYQTRQRQLTRATSRRKSCAILLTVNVFLMILLLFSVHTMLNYKIFAKLVVERDISDQKALKEHVGHIAFHTYPYRTLEWDTTNCGNYNGTDAKVIQLRLVDPNEDTWLNALNNDDTYYINKLEMIECHEDGFPASKYPSDLKQCAGLTTEKLPNDYPESNETVIFAPMVSNKFLGGAKNLVFHSNQLIARCPICMHSSGAFHVVNGVRVWNKDYHLVITLAQGWPAEYRFCSNLVLD